ncbi:hypothetical protein 65p436 [Aeromonas phage 65]|uniref:Uncharacterized protein n=2 Tax=Ishigurovirus osborne TaxID=260149 RepID=A0A219YCS4_9CAUD|nr:hypothetical protein ST65p436 [Aeromonas phage 65]ADQ53442.1 hypothetical protein 65p436 [Aeromonas phage 65]APU01798.1 hypothetical protein [Aeromonas phage 65.2]UYD59406.1 hypothetical protein HPMBJEAJ_00307 [Aeromonas phage avDM6]
MFKYKVWFASEEQKEEMIRYINEDELESCKVVIPYIKEIEVGVKYDFESNVKLETYSYSDGILKTTLNGKSYGCGMNLFISEDINEGRVCCEVIE